MEWELEKKESPEIEKLDEAKIILELSSELKKREEEIEKIKNSHFEEISKLKKLKDIEFETLLKSKDNEIARREKELIEMITEREKKIWNRYKNLIEEVTLKMREEVEIEKKKVEEEKKLLEAEFEKRKEDLENNFKELTEKLNREKDEELLKWLQTLDLPGNYRDLQKIAIYYKTFLDFDDKTKKMLNPKNAFEYAKQQYERYHLDIPSSPKYPFEYGKTAEEMEKEFHYHLEEWAVKTYRSRKEAAEKLGVSEKTLNNWKNKASVKK
jgi:hypothetical protein